MDENRHRPPVPRLGAETPAADPLKPTGPNAGTVLAPRIIPPRTLHAPSRSLRRPPPLSPVLVGCALHAEPAAPAAPPSVADFTLKDVPTDKPVSLGDFKAKKAVVVVFIGTECPINNAYMPRLAELAKTYADKGVAFLAINSNCNDTPPRIAGHAKKYELPFPVLRDPANVVADQFGAKRTPEVFLLDGSRNVVYQGRIDDQFGVGYKRTAPTRRDLAEALDEVLAGKPVSQPSTKAAGCFIARVVKPKADGSITFSKDVSRILQRNCQECHRPGQVGPMPLLDL